MIHFWVKEPEEKRDISTWKRDSFFSEAEITTNRLNKDDEKQDFEKDLTNFI